MYLPNIPTPSSANLEDGLQASDVGKHLALIFNIRITVSNHWVRLFYRDGKLQVLDLTATAGVTFRICCHTPKPSWYHCEQENRRGLVMASPLFARSRYNAVLFMRASHAQTVNP
jgi:hypothetical protein